MAADFSQADTEQLEALYFQGRFSELESQALLLIDRYPRMGFAWSVLGASLQSQGKDALFALQRAAELLPADPTAYSTLGTYLHALGQFEDAVQSYRQALNLHPEFVEVYNNLGNALRSMGKLNEAEASYRQALRINPKFAEAHFNLGIALKDFGSLNEAENSYRSAIQYNPKFLEAYIDLGSVLKEMGQLREAESNFRKALQLKPDSLHALNNLGNTLSELGELNSAVVSFRQALVLEPDFAEAHNNLGTILHHLGKFQEAEDAYRRSIALAPNIVDAYSNLLFHLCHNEGIDKHSLFAEHHKFAIQFEDPLKGTWPQHKNQRDPERVLSIGFVSGDLRDHAVASYIEPILENLAGNPRLSLHAYHNHSGEDDVTKRIAKHFGHWHPIANLSDDALAQKIQHDGIDILVDLSSHTAKNRLLTFARKPAPVQISWIGYAGTSGLSAMDYYIADRYFLPPGLFDDQFSEKIVQLPASAPFLPYGDSPLVNSLPALKNGYITFGTFNLLRKLTPSVIALWSQILRELPSARMVCGSMPQGNENSLLMDWFEKEGISRERLTFYPRCNMKDYLLLHHQVDLCLDTFPYPGATTSCHALWMGVPTLTLAGSTPVSRVGALVQQHVGMEQFIAFSKAEFVQNALALPGKVLQLAKYRSELRTRFAQSTMGKPDVIAEALERAMRTMWQRWCADLPPASFEVTAN